MADLDFMGYKRIVLKSDQEPSIVALSGLGPLPRARARAMEKLSVPFNLCTELARTLEQKSGIVL